MDVIIGIIIFGFMLWGAYKLFIFVAPKLKFALVFVVFAIALIAWVLFLESSGLSVIIAVLASIGGAWTYAKSKA